MGCVQSCFLCGGMDGPFFDYKSMWSDGEVDVRIVHVCAKSEYPQKYEQKDEWVATPILLIAQVIIPGIVALEPCKMYFALDDCYLHVDHAKRLNAYKAIFTQTFQRPFKAKISKLDLTSQIGSLVLYGKLYATETDKSLNDWIHENEYCLESDEIRLDDKPVRPRDVSMVDSIHENYIQGESELLDDIVIIKPNESDQMP